MLIVHAASLENQFVASGFSFRNQFGHAIFRNDFVTANGQACPGGVLPSGSALPNWYVTTGLSQGPNVVDGDSCTGFPSGANSCYVFTDRGTYDYLQSGEDPGATLARSSASPISRSSPARTARRRRVGAIS